MTSFYTCVSKITTMWCTVPEIRSETDWIFCHFGPIFCPCTIPPPNDLMIPKIKILKKKKKKKCLEILSFCTYMCTIKEDHMIYGSWNIRCDRHFLPFYPPNNPKNQNFEKMKKTPEDIIILHLCTINDNHIMYGFWDMKCDRQNFLSFWTIFCTFTLLKTWKIKILKKWKKLLEILSF